MRHRGEQRRWRAGLASTWAFLMRRPEVVKGLASMIVYIGKSCMLQYIQIP